MDWLKKLAFKPNVQSKPNHKSISIVHLEVIIKVEKSPDAPRGLNSFSNRAQV